MKTYNHLFEKVCSFENLYLAYLKARKCKRYKAEILRFGYNLEENLLRLKEELLNRTYQHGGYREFVVNDSKKRLIRAAPFRDRVIHHALCNIIEPVFDKGFVYDSYACRKGKGTHRAVKRLGKFIRVLLAKSKEEIYCLKCDISKYFETIDHKILFTLLKKKIADPKVLWLLKEILESSESLSPVGIPIGNLTSQLFANIYLNELDQFVKHSLRIRYYLRYMDDFIVLGFDKKNLHQVKKEIQEFVENKLKLKMHPKKANIFLVGEGIDFLGYRIFENHCLLRKSTVKRFIKRVRVYQEKLRKGLMTGEKFTNSLQSWLDYAKYADSWRLRKDLSRKLAIDLNSQSQ